jgi:hypothetical protein
MTNDSGVFAREADISLLPQGALCPPKADKAQSLEVRSCLIHAPKHSAVK